MQKHLSYQHENPPDSTVSTIPNTGLLRAAALLALLLLLISLSGHHLGGPLGALIAVLLALLVGGAFYWWADALILHMVGARRPAPGEVPWLEQLVGELARQARLPPPVLYLIDSPTPNAFATGRSRAHGRVAVTTAITHLLTRDELAGVLAHELSHIRQGHTSMTTITALLASGLALFACPACWPMFRAAPPSSAAAHTGRQYTKLISVLAPFAALIVQLGSARGREYRADEQGAALLGDPLLLASALEKIEWAARQMPMHANPGLASLYFVSPLPQHAGMLQFFNTHPSTANRVAHLRTLARQGWPNSPAPALPRNVRHDAL
jgi:heat shock protein HtpX